MITRLCCRPGVNRVLPVVALLVSAAFSLKESALAVTVRNPPPCVPEVSSGWVLLPVVLAILLFATRQVLQRREAQK
jgi:hypothetical protein